MFQFCAVNNVWIEFEWVPRSLNEYADSLSRAIDFDDWGFSTDFSAYIISLFGTFTVDKCASPDSAKSTRYYLKILVSQCRRHGRFQCWLGGWEQFVGATYLPYKSYSFSIGRYAALGAFSLSQSGLQQLFWPTVFLTGGLGPPILQVVEFSNPSFVFAPAQDCHNAIFCLFRFKSAVIALFLDGSFSRFLTFCFHTFLQFASSGPPFHSRQHFYLCFIVLFVFHCVHTFSYCLLPQALIYHSLWISHHLTPTSLLEAVFSLSLYHCLYNTLFFLIFLCLYLYSACPWLGLL